MMRTAGSFVLVGLVCAFTVGPAPMALAADDEDSVHAYWAQFDADHVTDSPVAEYLVNTDLLLDTFLEGTSYSIWWDAALETVLVEVDGLPVDDLVMVNAPGERPTWEGAFDQDGLPQLSGFVDVDEVNDLVVLQIAANGQSYRTFASPSGDGDPEPIPPAARCVCMGHPGGTTLPCSDNDCDVANSCGTAGDGSNKSCRWQAAPA